MRTFRGIVLMLMCAAAPALAQNGPMAQRLRAQIMQRFMENYRTSAGLTDAQYTKFQDAWTKSWQARRALQQHEAELYHGLEMQLRPGVAADADSVTKLMDSLVAVQEAQVQRTREDQRTFATFLSPVQEGQLVLMWQHFQQQIQDIMRRRMMQGQGRGGPGQALP